MTRALSRFLTILLVVQLVSLPSPALATSSGQTPAQSSASVPTQPQLTQSPADAAPQDTPASANNSSTPARALDSQPVGTPAAPAATTATTPTLPSISDISGADGFWPGA